MGSSLSAITPTLIRLYIPSHVSFITFCFPIFQFSSLCFFFYTARACAILSLTFQSTPFVFSLAFRGLCRRFIPHNFSPFHHLSSASALRVLLIFFSPLLLLPFPLYRPILSLSLNLLIAFCLFFPLFFSFLIRSIFGRVYIYIYIYMNLQSVSLMIFITIGLPIIIWSATL